MRISTTSLNNAAERLKARDESLSSKAESTKKMLIEAGVKIPRNKRKKKK